MQIDFNLLVIFQFLAVFQGITAAGLLLSRRSGVTARQWLGLLILALTLQSCNSLLINTGIYRDHHELYFMPLFFSWSYGPLLYFYIKNSAVPQSGFLKANAKHFIPVALQFLGYCVIFFTDLPTKTWFWLNVHKPYTRFLDNIVAVILILIYVKIALPYMKQTDQRFRRFLWVLLTFFVVAGLDALINPIYLPPNAPRFYLMELLLPVLSYWLALAIYWREQQTAKAQHQRVAVNEAQLNLIVSTVEGEQLYLNPELTLPDLAQRVNLNTNMVSQSLNNGLGINFNDFINQYRVNAFKQRIENGEHLTHSLLGVAFGCGFNSKNTFNRAFRKQMNLSPSEYIAGLNTKYPTSTVASTTTSSTTNLQEKAGSRDATLGTQPLEAKKSDQ
jgi:AraC-like DNA-binding protein